MLIIILNLQIKYYYYILILAPIRTTFAEIHNACFTIFFKVESKHYIYRMILFCNLFFRDCENKPNFKEEKKYRIR